MSSASHNPNELPAGLPVPGDDGACLHLPRAALPALSLPTTDGRLIDMAGLNSPTVLFFYPRTGVPGQPPSLGFHGEEWDSIPGARGCTPQSCGFRDLHDRFRALGVTVLGVSTNTTEHQREFKSRNHVAFEFLSDAGLQLTRALNLPTFEFPVERGGPNSLLKRMAWHVEPDALGVPRIVKVWYPVFPPDQNGAAVLAWMERRSAVWVRERDASDDAFVREELEKHWHQIRIWSIGRAFEADRLPAFVAEMDGPAGPERVGLVTYDVNRGNYQCEVVTVSSRREDVGVATRLLEAAENAARLARCSRVFLTMTNDNVKAFGFYQRRGWKLAALHRGNVEEARKRKALIPRVGLHGIEVRDEIELEVWLES